ncbi:helix-turn-helix transcriptional regulator [Myxacorys almedinensis]|uniref:Helix-turn-helix domain-containing protein n=1 Tax=Myxacorys almedinensis A TaxID=2690445 RepID=A0A8J7Z803_9CYAN|nr:AraC family transcriptional regulator [Myxacorys almedinensis]NDJ18058.1 helix-turn-helix domain-containing protein [Myxacorys almedinensis A]
MALTISGHACEALFEVMLEQSQYVDPEDEMDVVVPYPSELGSGQVRVIELREELHLEIEYYQQYRDLVVSYEEQQNHVRVGFHLSGFHRDSLVTVCPGEYALSGSGINPEGTFNSLAIEPVREVAFYISTSHIQSFFGELPLALQPLIRPLDQISFAQTYRTTPAIQVILHQLLQCPYHGILKRRYLETKVWELLLLAVSPLLIDSEALIKPSKKLKSEEVDRIHAARKILLQRLDHPPSLMELARLVGLNDRALKQGFRACFGTTTFGYLHQYRLDQARQLLATGDLKVEEVAQQVGFSNRSYFAEAFRKKFGVNPGDYARQQRQWR